MKKFFIFLTALLPLGVSAQIKIEQVQVFSTQHSGETTAVFMQLGNDSAENVNLVMVSSAAEPEAKFELHGMQNGKMLAITGIEIPAHGKTELRRGGLHIMAFDVKTPLVPDQTLPLTLFFDNGEKIDVNAKVVAR